MTGIKEVKMWNIKRRSWDMLFWRRTLWRKPSHIIVYIFSTPLKTTGKLYSLLTAHRSPTAKISASLKIWEHPWRLTWGKSTIVTVLIFRLYSRRNFVWISGRTWYSFAHHHWSKYWWQRKKMHFSISKDTPRINLRLPYDQWFLKVYLLRHRRSQITQKSCGVQSHSNVKPWWSCGW